MTIEYTTTKNASELLNISTSTLRVYAQFMETQGYTFKRIENARQYSPYDLQIIAEAMERYKKRGGSIKDALRYIIVREEHGEEEADKLEENHEINKEQPVLDLTQFKNDIGAIINSSIDNKMSEVIESIHNAKDNENDSEIEVLNKQIEALNAQLNAQLEENNRLNKELNSVKNMSIWEFRKWKK